MTNSLRLKPRPLTRPTPTLLVLEGRIEDDDAEPIQVCNVRVMLWRDHSPSGICLSWSRAFSEDATRSGRLEATFSFSGLSPDLIGSRVHLVVIQ